MTRVKSFFHGWIQKILSGWGPVLVINVFHRGQYKVRKTVRIRNQYNQVPQEAIGPKGGGLATMSPLWIRSCF